MFPPEALARRSSAVVSPHILTNNPTKPSPCHQPSSCPQPPLRHPSTVQVVHRCRVEQVIEHRRVLRSGEYCSGWPTTEAAPPGKPRHPRPTDPPPSPSFPAWGKVAAGKHCTLHLLKASIPSTAKVQEGTLQGDPSTSTRFTANQEKTMDRVDL